MTSDTLTEVNRRSLQWLSLVNFVISPYPDNIGAYNVVINIGRSIEIFVAFHTELLVVLQ